MRDPHLHLRSATADEVVDLRHALLRASLPRQTAIFDGDERPTTRHFVAETPGRIVACLSFMLKDLDGQPAWQLRGMAVAGDWQRRGAGTALLQYAEAQIACGSSPGLLWCNAREHAVGFYRRLGWTIVSQRFIIETAGPHYRMSKPLARPGDT